MEACKEGPPPPRARATRGVGHRAVQRVHHGVAQARDRSGQLEMAGDFPGDELQFPGDKWAIPRRWMDNYPEINVPFPDEWSTIPSWPMQSNASAMLCGPPRPVEGAVHLRRHHRRRRPPPAPPRR
eukprot:gene13043-biopygen6093